MPTNLPPDYFEVDKRYRAAQTIDEKVRLLEELISTVPKHKGTDKLRADLRDRLSKLKASQQSRKKISRQESAFQIEREGAGQAVVVGPTNVGKSALVRALTNAQPEVSEVPYTTWTPTPGMAHVENVQIQLVDTPPLDRDFLEGELFNLIRFADLILIVVDLQANPLQQLEETVATLEKNRIVRDSQPQRNPEGQRLVYKPFIILVNKCDDDSSREDYEIFCELVGGKWDCIPLSAVTGSNLEQLKMALFAALDIVRVYSKPPGKEADLTKPFVLKKGATVAEFAAKIHRDFSDKLKSARVWGSGAFEGQMVSRDHVLQDGDIVELKA